MTKNQEDYLSMSQTTFSFLQENTSVWQNNVPLTEEVTSIGETNDSLIDLQADQEKSHKGVTDNKQSDRTSTEESTQMVASILSYYAGKNKNFDLQEQVADGTIDLSRHSGLKLVGIAKVVLAAGTGNLAGATSCGLTQQMLNDLQKALEAFTINLNSPRAAIHTAATATDMLAAGIDSLHTDFALLDKGMVLYKSNVVFYNGLKKARTIIHSGTRHLAMTAEFTGTGDQPLPGVKIIIDKGDDKVLRKSSPKGNIRVQNLPDGEHKLIAEKPGFAKVELSFIVSPPETVKLTVVMKAI